MHVFPDALVLLSIRDPASWWESASETILRPHDNNPFATAEWKAMIAAMFAKLWKSGQMDRDRALAAFEANIARVPREVPANRLLVWNARDGWEPICKALDLPIPEEPFPRTNTREEWREREKLRTGNAGKTT
jgi:hypothetical protein